jgi:hypothetical protein
MTSHSSMHRCRIAAGLLVAIGLAACVPAPEPEPYGGKVFKYDGSVQCTNPGISVEDMAAELTGAGIEVLCGQKGSDGYAYAAVCGAGTGGINVYTISVDDLADVEALGFAPVRDLPEYQDQPCSP